MIFIYILIILFVLNILFFTPYPFIWMVRMQKPSGISKSPDDIDTMAEKVEVTLDIEYPSIYKRNTFDHYKPISNDNGTYIVWLHGGAFISQNSSNVKDYGVMLASHGYNVIAMNYAHAPENIFPAQVLQIDSVIELLNSQYDIKHLVLAGDSSGATIAASYATTQDNQALQETLDIKLQEQTKIDAMLLFCGIYDFTEDWKNKELKDTKKLMKYIAWAYLGQKRWRKKEKKFYASPIDNISGNFPPTYIVDGGMRSFLWQAENFVEKLKKEGVDVESHFFEEMPHQFQHHFQRYPKESMEVFHEVLEFLNRKVDKGEVYEK